MLPHHCTAPTGPTALTAALPADLCADKTCTTPPDDCSQSTGTCNPSTGDCQYDTMPDDSTCGPATAPSLGACIDPNSCKCRSGKKTFQSFGSSCKSGGGKYIAGAGCPCSVGNRNGQCNDAGECGEWAWTYDAGLTPAADGHPPGPQGLGPERVLCTASCWGDCLVLSSCAAQGR